MVIQAQRVLNDWFEISRVAHIPYKVYVPSVARDEPLQITKVAAALRYEDPTILYYSKGRELWVFGIDEPPKAPALRFSLVQSSKGTILPSSAALPHSSDAVQPWRFLAAVRNMVAAHMISTQDYLPFGERLIDIKTGELTHVVPGITSNGTLHLRLDRIDTKLRPSISKETPIVWLIPLGKQARLVDTFAAPSPALAEQFAQFLNEICFISLPRLTEGLWVQVRCDGHDVIWPQALVVSSQEPPMNLGWLKYLDNVTRMVEQTEEMAEMEKMDETGEPYQPEQHAAHHHHLMATLPSVYMPPPLPPPPPTPSTLLVASDGVYPTPQDNSPEVATHEHIHIPSSAAPATPAAPVAAGGIKQELGNQNLSSDPVHAPSTVEEWPEDEDWDEANEEVTIADFNYFDVPTAKPTSEPPRMIPDADAEKPSKRLKDDQAKLSPATQVSSSTRVSGAFAPLDFHSSLGMDQKYLEGGRYFTPNEGEEEEEQEDSPEDQLPVRSATRSSPSSEGSLEDDNEDDSDDDMSTENISEGDIQIPDPWSFKAEPDVVEHGHPPREDERYGDPQTYFSISRQRHNNISVYAVDNRKQPWHVESWMNLMTLTLKPTATDYISDESLQALMEQIVWDNGDASYLCQGSMVYGMRSPARQIFVNGLKSLYPAIRRLSLADICINNSTIAGTGVPSRPMSPVIPGAEAPQKQPASSPSTPGGGGGGAGAPPEELQFTLLSPPLYSIKRMGQYHKARSAILRFWKSFGLQPIGESRDIVLVEMSLSSRIRSQTRLQLLQNAKAMYEGCYLGKVTLPTIGPVKDGLMEINEDLDYLNPDTLGDLYENACSVLKQALAERFPPQTKVLLLMSWPSTHRATVLPLARGYLAIKSGFPNIRWHLLSNEHEHLYPDEIGTQSQFQLLKQALVWYDKWVGRSEAGLEPAFKLARLVPHSINLRYDEKPSAQIFDTDPTMHIAYSVSMDNRWVAAAWTDQWASVTRIKVYRLVVSDTSAQSPAVDWDVKTTTPLTGKRMESVFKQIWLDTVSICSARPKDTATSKWRIALIKAGPIDSSEAKMWSRVQSSVAWENTSSINILSIPRYSALTVHDGEVLFPHVAMALSCEPREAGGGREPSEGHSPTATTARRNDNVIVSAVDETHGIVFETKIHELENNAPVIAAGVFLKPLNSPSCSGNIQLEVCLVHGVNMTKNSMKQILGQFRRLSSLSENTGVSVDTTILPWHIAAVQKMVQALSAI